MLEIRKGTAAKNYENTFFREFAENLSNLFDKYSLDGLLIANSECELEKRLQIDALLVTKNAVCIIDFKNFGGKITLPKNAKSEFDFGRWTNEKGEIIKGGSSINPFSQLKNQKDRFIKVVEKQIQNSLPKSDCFNPYHTVRTVCFQKPIELIGSIPSKEELNFFIIDKASYLENIRDIIDITDKEVSLSQASFDLFKESFRADKFDISEQYEQTTDFTNYETELDFENLYPDQKSALSEMESFITSDEERFFVLQGTSLSGKSHLIPFIQDIAFNNRIPEVKLFASSGRVANNLLKDSNLEFDSMYSYIYGGNTQNEKQEETEETENDEILNLEIVPLKKSDDTEEAIFIVDESHLVSDNYHQSIDLRFGSGKLLEDFIKFADLKNTKRKIIFVGDSFQLSIGKKEESALNPDYLSEKYEHKSKAFQLIDKGNKSPIVEQALKAVNCIKSQSFNNLSFNVSDTLSVLAKNELLPNIEKSLKSNGVSHILCFSNYDAQKVNFWIKNAIIKNGSDLQPEDLVLFSNNIRVEDENDPFAEPKKIYNGQFGNVQTVSDSIIKRDKLLTPLTFREISIQLHESNHTLKFLSFENFRMSDKGELSKEEIISYKILLNQLAEKEVENFKNGNYQTDDELSELLLKLTEGKKVKTKVLSKIQRILSNMPSTEYYQFKNSAQLRFGWAMTVHKAMSYKWDEIYLNLEPGAGLKGRTNETYFKWAYTGLIRAKQKVNLINYEPINPFYQLTDIEIKDHNSGNKPNDKILFQADIESVVQNKDSSVKIKYHFPDGNQATILHQIFNYIKGKLDNKKFEISTISHNKNQEVYEIKAASNELAYISIYYRDNGRVNLPTLMKATSTELGDEILKLLITPFNSSSDLSFVTDKWRQGTLSQIIQELANTKLEINYLVQSSNLDTLKISRDSSVLIVLMDYEIDGFYSGIRANYYSDENIWSDFKSIITELKKK